MSADLVRATLSGNLLGFAIDKHFSVIRRSISVRLDAAQEESVYFRLEWALGDISDLNGRTFRATMASKTNRTRTGLGMVARFCTGLAGR